MNYDVIVVGAGASGLIASIMAARNGAEVLLIERNEKIGRKIMITGKGRCNVTNNCDVERLMSATMRNNKFLFGAYNAFPPADVMEFFESLGVPLKTERGQRVFPVSDRAVDIVDALFKCIKKEGITLERKRVGNILFEDGKVTGIKTVDGLCFLAPSVIIATGGLSYPATGSTGDGYKLAEETGHKIMPTAASLVPIVLKEKWCSELIGLSLKNVTLKVKKGKKVLFEELGEMMFTHFGISGPLVLSASALIDGDMKEYSLLVDLKPALDEAKLDERILRDFEGEKNKAFKNSLYRLLPRSLVPVIIKLSGIDENLPVNSVTKEMRRKLISVIKGMPLTPCALRPVEEAVITRGGVSVKDINPKTMESKKLSGLYFCGEVIDVDAVTGGFNLQIAFSTGFLAGNNCF